MAIVLHRVCVAYQSIPAHIQSRIGYKIEVISKPLDKQIRKTQLSVALMQSLDFLEVSKQSLAAALMASNVLHYGNMPRPLLPINSDSFLSKGTILKTKFCFI